MPRVARAVIPDCPHHVTQRGNNRQDVFFVRDDYNIYLEILHQQAVRYGLEIHAYCLMTNHVHIVATPQRADSLAKAIGRTHWLYTQTINRLHRRSGHLWQGRFYSCALDTRHFWLAMKYIEQNPVRARLCRKPWRYVWSSAAAHVDEPEGKGRGESAGGRAGNWGQVQPASRNVPVPNFPVFLNLAEWFERVSGEQWRGKLVEGLTEGQMERIRGRTHTGRPLGSDGFVSKLEAALGRRVRALPVGRPKKQRD